METLAKEGRPSPQNGSGDSKQATNYIKHWPKENDRVHFTLWKVDARLITQLMPSTFRGALLPLRNIYGSVAGTCCPTLPQHYTHSKRQENWDSKWPTSAG